MGWETHNKVVIGRFWAILPVYFLLKSLKTRCFYSKVARHSLSLGNRAFSSNPEARVLSACKWSGKLNRYGVVLLDRKFFLSYSAPKKRGAFLHLQSVKKPTTRQTSDANEFVNAKSTAKKKPLHAREVKYHSNLDFKVLLSLELDWKNSTCCPVKRHISCPLRVWIL